MDEQSAFPYTEHCRDGMSLRDYFAAKAMQAFINRDEWQSTVKEVSRETAFNAYAMADAMMKEREA
jgi:hypothetical protein